MVIRPMGCLLCLLKKKISVLVWLRKEYEAKLGPS